jgi:hypothetical protein
MALSDLFFSGLQLSRMRASQLRRNIGKSSWLKTILSHEVRAGKERFFHSYESGFHPHP